MQLSKNFSLKELTASQTADRHGISNNPSEDHMDNLKRLCDNVLQKVRDHYGKVVSVSSGYRSPELCLKIGSSAKSQHAKGQAADFEIFGVPNAELAKYIIDNLDFDQLILEYHNPEEPNSGWIHCSYKNSEENRKQVLRAYRNDDGKTVYEPYDPSWAVERLNDELKKEQEQIIQAYMTKGTWGLTKLVNCDIMIILLIRKVYYGV